MSSYNNTHRFLANIISITYNNPENRPPKLFYLGEVIEYKREKSTQIYSHYEGESVIIIGVKGVSDMSSLTQALGEYKLNNSIQTAYVSDVSKKYQSLVNETKEVFFTGHSLGGYSIISSAVRSKKKFKSILFAPYLPTIFGSIASEYMNPIHKKIFFSNDPVPFKLLMNFWRLTNSLVFNPPSRLAETHSISNFQQSPNVLNKLLNKYYP